MKYMGLPLYCGGRFLMGFTTYADYNDDDLIERHLSHIDFRDVNYGPNWKCATHYEYSPKDLTKFQQLFKLLLGTDLQIGSILAVTNTNQINSAKNLEQTGFKIVKRTSKYGLEPDYTPNCSIWHGDFLKDVLPILRKVPNYVRKPVAPVKPAPSRFSTG